ncbi:MAG: C25 family peptidase propeptide domain-containing protein, partial [Bacteroidota bacterium]
MRKVVLLVFSLFSHSVFSATWTGITSSEPTEATISVLSQTESELLLFIRVEGFSTQEVSIDGSVYQKISSPGCTPILEAGAPDLPKLVAPLLVPFAGIGEVEVVSSAFRDFPMAVSPSKGNLYRDQNPSEVPYQFGDAYAGNSIFPESLVNIGTPYVLRDFTGQSLRFFPFRYDHATRTLRVYHAITLRLKASGGSQWPASNAVNVLDIDYAGIYARHFINFNSLNYSPVYDQGNMLVIADSSLMLEMGPFISWKNRKGQRTEMVSMQQVGATAADIRAFVSNYYYT